MIYNPLLDGFPTEYEGFKLNTGYKVGIQLSNLLDDSSVSENIKIMLACKLLFTNEVPDDLATVIKTIEWFLSCGRSDYVYADGYVGKSSKDKALSYDNDGLLIWATFRQVYDIDLSNKALDNMHYFKFRGMIDALPDYCPLSHLMSTRCIDTSKMKGDIKRSYDEAKSRVKVRSLVTKEEFKKILSDDVAKYGSYYALLKSLNS